MDRIPLTRARLTKTDLDAVDQVMSDGKLDGGGRFSEAAEDFLRTHTGAPCALVTTSGTAALELAMLLLELGPGDEVILPSFTFSSTANAVILRGAVPVFVDVDTDTFNLCPKAVEKAIGPRTRAIIPVHYAGVGCDMDALARLADKAGLALIEDAAHAIGARYRDKPLGSFGKFAAFSFHNSKNLSSGEGGALIINDPDCVERSEILLEKGTTRRKMMRGTISKYTWVDVGSSFVPSELTAALISSQLRQMDDINRLRVAAWQRYADHPVLRALEADGCLTLQKVPRDCDHNAHLYVMLLPTPALRDDLSAHLGSRGIDAWRHYVPLHSAVAGRKYGTTPSPLPVTEDIAERLIRLPLHAGLTPEETERVVAETEAFLRSRDIAKDA